MGRPSRGPICSRIIRRDANARRQLCGRYHDIFLIVEKAPLTRGSRLEPTAHNARRFHTQRNRARGDTRRSADDLYHDTLLRSPRRPTSRGPITPCIRPPRIPPTSGRAGGAATLITISHFVHSLSMALKCSCTIADNAGSAW